MIIDKHNLFSVRQVLSFLLPRELKERNLSGEYYAWVPTSRIIVILIVRLSFTYVLSFLFLTGTIKITIILVRVPTARVWSGCEALG